MSACVVTFAPTRIAATAKREARPPRSAATAIRVAPSSANGHGFIRFVTVLAVPAVRGRSRPWKPSTTALSARENAGTWKQSTHTAAAATAQPSDASSSTEGRRVIHRA